MPSTHRALTLRRLLTNPAALLGLCIVLDVIVAVARAHTAAPPSVPPVLRQFASTIDAQYHECVPLGWFPEGRPARGYYPVSNADVAVRGAALEALWVGEVPARMLADPHVAAVKSVLDELTRLDLLVRHEIPGGFRYNLTRNGQQYYYERNIIDDNIDGWSYLCFSRLHAKGVAWASRPTEHRTSHGTAVTARIRFTWEPTADAAWTTPFVKAHAVELNPTSSPAKAIVSRSFNGRWRLAQLDFAFPVVEHRSAWASAASNGRSARTRSTPP